MKAQFKVNAKLIIEVEADSQKELFRELASVQEVFGEKCCGKCQSTSIVFAYRKVRKFEYPEYHCLDCHARLSMGSMQEGGALFPIRKLTADGRPSREEGAYGDHNGWTKYRGDKHEETPSEGSAA